MIAKQIKHLPLTATKTKCGIKITNDNIVIDINMCTCRRCKK